MSAAADPPPAGPAAGPSAALAVPHVTAIGGGHGLSSTLRALRRYAGRITAVVSVADDGGSSGRLRRTTGLPAPGDLRRCLVALADPGSLWARAFEHRFAGGELDGHALGNLVIAGLAEVTGDFGSALVEAARLLAVEGRVLPATAGPVSLKGEVDGADVVGQARLSESPRPIGSVSIVPADAPADPEALRAVEDADQVVLGPGSLFTSVLAACVVPELRDALARRRAGTVYVPNLRPQLPETAGMDPAGLLQAVLTHGVAVHDVVVDSAAAAAERRALSGVAAAAGVAVHFAPLARPDRAAHDPVALGAALAALVPRHPGR